jgi:hypothetical protein
LPESFNDSAQVRLALAEVSLPNADYPILPSEPLSDESATARLTRALA